MLVVTDGSLVIEDRIYVAGEEINGLASDVEKKLVASGLAEYADSTGLTGKPTPLPDAFAKNLDGTSDDWDTPLVFGAAEKPLTKAELQAICREYGLSERGNKAELIARIEAYGQAAAEELEDEQPPDLKAEVPR